MALADLLSRMEGRETDTPDTSCNPPEVSAKPLQDKACTLDTPDTSQNASAEDWALFNAWLFHFTDRDDLLVLFVPAVDHAAALSCYPDAVAAVPMADGYTHLTADETPEEPADDRRTCSQCQNLRGRVCGGATPGGVVSANKGYRPQADTLQRCAGYLPNVSDTDRRTGSERWPGLTDTKGTK